MTTKRKAPLTRSNSQPELILSLDSYKPRISKKKISSTITKSTPFMKWWDDTLENHWPLDNPPDWDLLSPSQKRTWKMAAIGYCLRDMEASKCK